MTLNGGAPEVKGPIARFSTIGPAEVSGAEAALRGPLSGYLGGELTVGRNVAALEECWAEMFGVKHAVACNSATSGLLAACAALHHGGMLGAYADVICSPLTMSATAAAPAFFGAPIRFGDIEDYTFCLRDIGPIAGSAAVIVTNLFGHPAPLHAMRRACDQHSMILIEDNAQAPFAMENGRYTGTIGHIGVFSLNVHKHIQCGEGGVCVTNNHALANLMRHFINHGELAGNQIGLNLRMTEVTAAIARAQLMRGQEIVQGRVDQAERLIAAIGNIPGIRPLIVRDGCRHVYYTVPFLIDAGRDWFVKALAAEGVPIVESYSMPLYMLPAFKRFERPCPMAEDVWQRLFYFENCAWDPTPAQITQIGNAFQKVAEAVRNWRYQEHES